MSDEPKKKRKHRKHTINDFYHGNKLHKEKYGFIEIDNPVNYIIAHNGKYIDMLALADKLCISERLMQMTLKSLREEGLIEVVHTFSDTGKQLKNVQIYRCAG